MISYRLSIVLATALYGASAWHSPRAEDHLRPGALVRELVKPMVLPRLWADWASAERRGDPVEIAAAGRSILHYLPDWVDGHVHFAWTLTIEAIRSANSAATGIGEPVARLERDAERVLIAADWLQTAGDRQATSNPDAAANLWMAKALMLQHVAADCPVLGTALRQRIGEDATLIARRAIEAAIRIAPSEVKRDALAHVTVAAIAGALRLGDVERANRLVDAATALLQSAVDQEAAAPAFAAIRTLEPFEHYLHPHPDTHLDALLEQPQLAAIEAALRALRLDR